MGCLFFVYWRCAFIVVFVIVLLRSLTLITWYVCINFYIYKRNLWLSSFSPARQRCCFFLWFYFPFIFFLFSRVCHVFWPCSLREQKHTKISSIGKKLAFLCLKNVNFQKHNFLLYLSLFFSHLHRATRLNRGIFFCFASLLLFSVLCSL